MHAEEAWAQLHHAADLAAARGSLLFHLDLATELAQAAFALDGIAAEGLATLVDEQGYCSIAFDASPARRALAEARFDGSRAVQILPAFDRLPPRATTLADARATIAATSFAGAATHAALVVPADDPRAPIEGYAIAIGDGADMVQSSGHWLVTLDGTGRQITGREPLVVTTGPAPASVPALRDTTLSVAGAVPGEIHAYLSLKHGVPLVLHTLESGVSWRVDGERTDVLRQSA